MLVTSGLDVNLAYGMATYQQIFRDNARSATTKTF
jgi:hypothetical protein